MTLIERLSEFSVGVKLEDIPRDTVQFTKQLALKTTAGMLVGSRLPQGEKILRYVREKNNPPEVGVVGSRLRTSVEEAILVNGFFAHVSELEDDQYPGPTSDITIFPVVYPLAEKLKLTGREFIEACVVGMEIMNRISYATQPRTAQLGILPLSFYGVIGAGLVAAKALKLSLKETRAALGLALSQAAGNYANLGTDAHYLESAWACRNGFVAAVMAARGFTGGVEMERFLTTLLGEGYVQFGQISEKIGRPPFYIHNIWIKKYPCCFLTHRQIDGLFALMEEHTFDSRDVKGITIDVGSADAAACDRPDPTDPESAKFSYQHILAAVLLDRKVDLETFSDRKISEPRLRAFRPKVHVVSHPEWGAGTQAGIARISVRLNDGTTLVREIDQPLGSKKYPLSAEQCWDLYRKYTHGILEETDVARSMTIILNMEHAENLEEISRILAG